MTDVYSHSCVLHVLYLLYLLSLSPFSLPLCYFLLFYLSPINIACLANTFNSYYYYYCTSKFAINYLLLFCHVLQENATT